MSIAQILHVEASVFLYGLAAIVVYQMLTGGINTKGLLSQKRVPKKGESPGASPERIQLLLATIAAASNYLAQAARTGTMPDVSKQWLYLMGGSSGLYAVGKLIRTQHHKRKLQEGR